MVGFKSGGVVGLLWPLVFLVFQGCASVLPSARQDVKSPWKTFDEAKKAFDQVQPYKTNEEELKKLGFDPFASPNVRILNYLDIFQRFLPNSSLKKSDLDKDLVDCLDAKNACKAYEITVRRIRQKRYGNVFLDLFGFKRRTQRYGWEFHAFIFLKDNLVVYKIWSGQPLVDENEEKKNPLGPLQEPTNILPTVTPPPIF